MKRFLIFTLVLLLAVLSVGAESLRAPRGFAGKMWASTFALYGSLGTKTRFDCTAEAFEKIPGGYHLLSAGHCVLDVPAGVSFSVSEEIGGPRTPVTIVKSYQGQGIDLAEFELKTAKKYPIMTLGDESDVRIGDPIINPNFAAGLGKQLSYGRIGSNTLPVSRGCDETSCAGDIIVQADGAGGSSGSAVISIKTHRVVGILVWGFDENIGFGIEPISNFRKFQTLPDQTLLPHPEEN